MDENLKKSEEVQEAILKYLYGVLSKAKNENMTHETDVQIQHALRDSNSYTDEEVNKELIYLVGAGMVKRRSEPYSYNQLNRLTGKYKMIKGKQIDYKISDKGVDSIQGPSKFQRRNNFGGININNVHGAVAIGENNTVIVHQDHFNIYNQLNELEEAVRSSEVIPDEDKVEYTSDIGTLKSQIAKKQPNRTIIGEAWKSLSALATIEGVMQLYDRIHPLIAPFLQ